MIRIVTKARLARLAAGAKQARDRAIEVQEKADAVSSTYFRTVAELTARTVQAEEALAAYADVATALRAELDTAPALGEVVLLVRYGQPHSIHRGVHAAKARAVAEGAVPDGWRPCSGAPAASDAWATIVFIFDEATGAFMCSVAPSLPVPGGAG
ncbi:hypothetical protein [Streptomyces sp. wa22]|uniref:hypothetical protein n=1 Tax=Streptomyces sp. wa22 TaxID=1828244 RepID=UPI0011CAEF70|nr:hypothetical protein [Streptomyces sp. wa22]TXS06907.1 hypothetical protein EAO68_39100 [Streptomyces sp. wa22]